MKKKKKKELLATITPSLHRLPFYRIFSSNPSHADSEMCPPFLLDPLHLTDTRVPGRASAERGHQDGQVLLQRAGLALRTMETKGGVPKIQRARDAFRGQFWCCFSGFKDRDKN